MQHEPSQQANGSMAGCQFLLRRWLDCLETGALTLTADGRIKVWSRLFVCLKTKGGLLAHEPITRSGWPVAYLIVCCLSM